MKLIVDMNLSPRWVNFLLEADIIAEHWSSLGPTNAPDSQIMAFARVNGYVILTNDLDFGQTLAATQAPLPSVFQIRSQDLSPKIIGPSVIIALRQSEAELTQGALLTFDLERIRLRVLPLT